MFVLRELLGFMGIEPERLQITWCSASEGSKWAEVVEDTCKVIDRLGPLKKVKDLTENLRSEAKEIKASGS
jgi:coenzyme F420-reducing hydrogenase delta subunit